MQLKKTEIVKIPDNVTLTVDDQKITVKGPRGELTRDFHHVPMDIQLHGKQLNVTIWFPRAKLNAIPRTIASHVENMITGVSKGFQYVMKAAHAHFPMEFNVKNNNTLVEIRNYIGMKQVNITQAEQGVQIFFEKEKKNELRIVGNDLEKVSYTCAKIRNSCRIHNKDLRKFLDGVYVSEKGTPQ